MVAGIIPFFHSSASFFFASPPLAPSSFEALRSEWKKNPIKKLYKFIVQKYKVPEWYVNGQNPWYIPGKFLEVGVGNNSFSLPKKADRNRLEITPLKVGSLDDLKLGKHVAFQDFEGDRWLECVGLESAILSLDYRIPVYVFDNHNHVFYAWAEALKMGWFQQGATLVHMDEHFDAAEALLPPDPLTPFLLRLLPLPAGSEGQVQGGTKTPEQSLEEIWRYTNEVLQIATYIKPALKLGVFSECIDYVESQHFEAPVRTRHGAFVHGAHAKAVVINLDIDVFHPDMSHISWQQKIDVLKYYLPQTKLITIATSPYFIDQQKAIDLVHQVVNQLFPA